MPDKVIVFVTCEREQATEISEVVVGEKLAACVNVVSGVQSCYLWEGKMTWADEVLLVIKTTRERYDSLEAQIKAIHRYEVPEIVSVAITDGLEKYLEWIDLSTITIRGQ